jgi:RNA polymerase sigma factor (sigma-70 family)
MADLKIAIRQMLRMLSAGQSAGLPDDELLKRFLEQRDEAAFESLLCRHGPMVLNTCRRLLGHLPDAEDAFQATFLVFCRKAKTIARRQSLGSWLHRVALRICLRAKATSQRAAGGLKRRFEQAAPLGRTGAADRARTPLEQQEEWSVLDEELNRLPEKYRAPLVLHYLEGKTAEQAAVELGWRPGTVCGRLARGKDLLRSRLIRRGVTLTAGMVAGLVAPDLATAALPPALVKATVRAGIVFAGGQAVVPGAASARLAQRFLRAGLFGRLKLLAAVFLTVGIATAGAGVILSRTQPTDRIAKVPPLLNAAPPNEAQARVDGDGDPLPAGARLRLGSARLGHGDWLKAMAYSRDGRALVAAGDRGLVHTWDAATGRPLATVAYSPFAYQTQPVLSPDGATLAVAVASDSFGMKPNSTVLLMSLSRNAAPLRLAVGSNGDVRSLAFSPDGNYLAAGGNFDFILLWEVASGHLVRRFTVSKHYIQAVAVSPDGKLLAVDNQPALRLWDVATGEEDRQPLEPKSWGTVLAFSGDGRVLAGGDTLGKISLWDWHTGKALRQFAPPESFLRGRMDNLAFSPDSKLPCRTRAGRDCPPLGYNLRRIATLRPAAGFPE